VGRSARGFQPAATPPDRETRERVYSQNFLVDPRVIENLAVNSGMAPGELVLDIGAGNGLITEALRGRGGRVTAIERDPELARRLRAEAGPGVTVAEGDILTMPLPAEAFRVVANLPFGITTKILRRLLDDPKSRLSRADVIVQAEVARKRGTPGKGNLLNACWEPWWEFWMGARIPASAFRPRPRVEAAVLVVRRREPPLVDVRERRGYVEFVTAAFGQSRPDVASGVRFALPRSRFAGVAASLGLDLGALPSQVSGEQWAGLYRAAHRQPPRRG
jgi:23S rRNA (adenine-N6)-dimethyltransferase